MARKQIVYSTIRPDGNGDITKLKPRRVTPLTRSTYAPWLGYDWSQEVMDFARFCAWCANDQERKFAERGSA